MGLFSDLKDKAEAAIAKYADKKTDGIFHDVLVPYEGSSGQGIPSQTSGGSDTQASTDQSQSQQNQQQSPAAGAAPEKKDGLGDMLTGGFGMIIKLLIAGIAALFGLLLGPIIAPIAALVEKFAGDGLGSLFGGLFSNDKDNANKPGLMQSIGDGISNKANGIKTDIDQWTGQHVFGYTAPPATKDIITAAANKYNIDPNAMLTWSKIESNWNPNAVNKYAANPDDAATGLFQFMPGTASQFEKWWNRKDPVKSSEYAAQLWSANASMLQKELKRPPTNGELYLAAQQGAGGAAVMIEHANDGTPAWKALMDLKKYRNNESLAKEAITHNGGTLDMTAGQFAAKWTDKFDATYTQVAAANSGAPPVPGQPGVGQQLVADARFAPSKPTPVAPQGHVPKNYQELAQALKIQIPSAPAPAQSGSKKPKDHGHDDTPGLAS